MKKVISLILSAVMLTAALSFAFGAVTTAASATVAYTFSGSNAADRGFAEGTITVSAGPSNGGTYYLYWADDSAALDGFEPITSMSVAASGSATFSMPEFAAIPADATKIIAFNASSAPSVKTVSAATAVYEIPSSKLLGYTSSEKLYSFASFSDFHMSEGSYGLTNYPYDNEHAAAAWKVAAAHDVDFAVTTGDHVNNQREDSYGGNNPYYAQEWESYLKILADSDYVNPVYEAIGNHELWNYDTESNYSGMDWQTGTNQFIAATGLDATTATVSAGAAYYEITEPNTGDHFLFMALEGGFYTDRVDEFSDTQLAWLEKKLKAYENDGHNTFILQHCNFYKWGAGDQLSNPIYDIPLKDTNASTVKLKNLLKTYQNAVMLNGHTHFKFARQLNYSTNDGTSATIIHNSAVGAVRDISNGTTRVNDKSLEQTEGYIVEVYQHAVVFYGLNLYSDSIYPTATYIVKTGEYEEPTETPTEAVTTVVPGEFLLGDVNLSGTVDVTDATVIQRFLASLMTLSESQQKAADTNGNGAVEITDATLIQRYLAKLIDTFPAESAAASTGAGQSAEAAENEDLADTGAAIDTLRTQVATALSDYYLYASYDQYQALKKAYKNNASYSELNAAYTAFSTAVGNFGGDTIDVYFSNNCGWSNVYAYCWDYIDSSTGHSHSKNGSWPGTKCTYVSTNGYGEKIYKFTVERGKYNYIIFTDGTNQTIDLPLGIAQNVGYYTAGMVTYTDKNGNTVTNYLAKQYVYQ